MRETSGGVLVLNKPAGITSRDALNRVGPPLRGVKMGHAGTLDPMASGVLVVCLGAATRLIPYVQRMRKHYSATIRLGQRSASHDLESPVEEVAPAPEIDSGSLERALGRFRGTIVQVPPQFSAVHVEGRRAYELARRGRAVPLEPRVVHVERLECTRFEHPWADLEIECGSGTYIRALTRDVGEELGCGAVLTRLVRTAVGPFQLRDAADLDGLTPEGLAGHLRPLSAAVQELPSLSVPEETRRDIFHGRPIPLPPAAAGAAQEFVLCDRSGEVLAVAHRDAAGKTLRPHIVFIREEEG